MSVVFVLNDIVLVLAVTHELVPYHFYSFYAAPVMYKSNVMLIIIVQRGLQLTFSA